MQIDNLTEGADIVRFIKAQRIKCLGHIQMSGAYPNVWGAYPNVWGHIQMSGAYPNVWGISKCLGHIQRMDQARPTRKLLDWKPMGSKPVGKPRQRWQKDVLEDLKKLKIKNWKEAAKDRRTWRDLAEKAKTHKGL